MATVLKTTDVRCRIEGDLKEHATEILKACGLSVSDAMRLFLRQVVATQGLPFDVRAPSEKTSRALAQAREIRGRFDSIDELFKDLDGQEAPKAGKRKAGTAAQAH